MDLAAELADKGLNIRITIASSSAHILVYRPKGCGTEYAAARVPNDADLFARIDAEIERLLEGCDETTDL